MIGSENNEPTVMEIQENFNKLITDHIQDVDKHFVDTMEQLTGLEASFTTKMGAKFQEVLARLPPAQAAGAPHIGGARCVTVPQGQASVAGAQPDAYYGADESKDKHTDEGEVLQQPPGRPRAYIRNARHQPHPLVCDDDHVAKLKLNVPTFDGRYNPDAYLSWELEVQQRFTCLNYPEDKRVSAATCEVTSFASIWWAEYCRVNYATPITTWDALKHAMSTRFVPPYYEHTLLTKLTCLDQGKNLVEEYYQELQTGMMHCGIVEDDEQILAQFLGGLNTEIQTILRYKTYHTITRLFHLACNAELEVQERREAMRTNFSTGRSTSWRTTNSSSRHAAPVRTTPTPTRSTTPTSTPFPAKSVPAGPTPSSFSSMASTGKSSKVQCHKCTVLGHFARE
jgi:hypothetical protein